MTAPYVFSPLAQSDLFDLWEWIARDSLRASDSVIDRIEAACMLLAEFPRIGHARADLAPDDVLFWRVLSYLIVYRPETQPLEIVRVLSSYRDVAAELEADRP